jgi:4,5-DOPA dioxygenase extradiol
MFNYIFHNFTDIQKRMTDLISSGESSERMPVFFIGHGSPLYTIQENEFVETWKNLGKTIPVPKAVLCISAHWQTKGTYVTAMAEPPTIHDFGGFPRELYNVHYPAPGSPALADKIKKSITGTTIGLDERWGLDHGAWTVIRHIFPAANIPVIELSLDYSKSPGDHYDLAKELFSFRNRGILIIGSGNMVHNLGRVDPDHTDEPEFGYDWAIQANDIFKRLITSDKHTDLINYRSLGEEVQLSVPTPEHFLPLLYALALKKDNEPVEFFSDKAVMGSLTMTSLRIG